MMIVVIPARGGSKGVPGKNIKRLSGKPLIQYTIDAAREVFKDDQIIVSTDSEDIKKTVESLGLKVPFMRPPHLATDQAGTREVLLDVLEHLNTQGIRPETLVLLQPTSPFRTGEDIKRALEIYRSDLEMVVSVKETKANPYYVLREEDENGFLVKSKQGSFTRRQDCPKVWEINGAIYIINVSSLLNRELYEFQKVKKYKMDDMSSHDIDTPLDWTIAEVVAGNSLHSND